MSGDAHDQLINKIMEHMDDSWDGDEDADSLVVAYVATITARLRALVGDAGMVRYPESAAGAVLPDAAVAPAVYCRAVAPAVPLVELMESMTDAVTLIREALHRAFPEAYTPRCAVCATRVPAGAVECQDCAGGEDAAAKRAADV